MSSFLNYICKKIIHMKNKYIAIATFISMVLMSCVTGGTEEVTETVNEVPTEVVETVIEEVVAEEVATADYSAGEEVYGRTCKACHQATGKGIPSAFPPLAESDYLLEDKNRAIKIVLEGLTGEVTVNGDVYNSVMTPQAISDQEVVDVLNYVLNSWGNAGGEVTLEDVAAQK